MPRTFSEEDFVPQPAGKRTFNESDFSEAGQQPSLMSKIAQSTPAQFLKGTAEGVAAGLNPIEIGKSLLDPITPMLEELKKAKEAHDKGDVAGTYFRLMTGVFPYLGPLVGGMKDAYSQTLNAETPEQRGQGFGTMLSVPVGGKVLPAIVKGAGELAQRTAAPLYESALKPSTTLKPAKRASIIQTGLEEKIPVPGKFSDRGLKKADAIISDIKAEIDSRIKAAEAAGAEKIAPADVAKRAEELKPEFKTVTPKTDIAPIEATKKEFIKAYSEKEVTPEGKVILHPERQSISVTEAQKIKQNTYRRVGDKAYGEQKTPGTEAEKQLARGLKEELETALKDLVPELKSMNARESAVIGLDKALERAAARIRNHQIFGIGTPIAMAGGYALAGEPGAMTMAILKLVLDDPEVKSRVAIVFNRARSAAAKATSPGMRPLYGGVAGMAAEEENKQP